MSIQALHALPSQLTGSLCPKLEHKQEPPPSFSTFELRFYLSNLNSGSAKNLKECFHFGQGHLSSASGGAAREIDRLIRVEAKR